MSGRPVVERTLCASTGICESIAPDLFEIGDDGALHVLVDVVPADRADDAGTAATACPTGALRIVDEG